MGQAAERPAMTYAEYLAFEVEAEGRHEFDGFEIVAMSGGSRRHAAITANVTIALGNALRGKPCRPTSGDQRVYVPATDAAFYGDITIVCGDFESPPEDPDAITNPTVIVEVLSRSTADRDRGTKFEHYRTLASLTDYLLVDQRARHVEHRRRVEPGQDVWLLSTVREGAVEMASLGIALAIDDVYADLEGVDAPEKAVD